MIGTLLLLCGTLLAGAASLRLLGLRPVDDGLRFFALSWLVGSLGTALLSLLWLCGPRPAAGPVLWILHEVVVTREARWLDALKTVGRIAVMTLGCSLWWIAGLWEHHLYAGDEQLLRDCLPAVHSVLDAVEKHAEDDGLVFDMPGWVFIDWADVQHNGPMTSFNAANLCDDAPR